VARDAAVATETESGNRSNGRVAECDNKTMNYMYIVLHVSNKTTNIVLLVSL